LVQGELHDHIVYAMRGIDCKSDVCTHKMHTSMNNAKTLPKYD